MSYPKGRDYIIKQVKGKVMSQTQGNYPAPLEIIDVSTTYCFSQIKTWQVATHFLTWSHSFVNYGLDFLAFFLVRT